MPQVMVYNNMYILSGRMLWFLFYTFQLVLVAISHAYFITLSVKNPNLVFDVIN